jgi:protein kinase-like protein
VAILAEGSELAGYRIDELIARGGMGVVYRGTDLRLGRPVAIKLIAADRAAEPSIRQRFEREARLMASIEHPNVLPVYAAGEADGSLYLVMRFVPGTDLAAVLHARGRLDPVEAVRITGQVAAALDAAHAGGLVHRDIKPANVLLTGDHTYLGDFGIGRVVEAATRLTDTDDWLGTVDFCSPEQLRGERTDARSDVYSLACLLQTALTGAPPHHRESAAAVMYAHLNEEPARASDTGGVPGGLDAVLARGLAKRPVDRYPSAGALAEAARAALAAPRGTTPMKRPRRVQPTRRRGETAVSATRRLRGATRTRLDLRPDPDQPPPDAHGEGPAARLRAPYTSGLGLLVAVLVIGGGLLGVRSGTSTPGRLSRSEITGLVARFGVAYGERRPGVLAGLLAPGVVQVSPNAIERGQAAVATALRRELGDTSIVGYRLSATTVAPGWIGRAAGRYVIVRTGHSDLSGQVTFGVDRVAGQPRIVLIAVRASG